MNRTVAITVAAGGSGRTTAREFARRGARIALLARLSAGSVRTGGLSSSDAGTKRISAHGERSGGG